MVQIILVTGIFLLVNVHIAKVEIKVFAQLLADAKE